MRSERCYEKHPAYEIAPGFVVYGGSCFTPVVEDADVYVALDHGWRPTQMAWPWREGVAFLYTIDNMKPPQDTRTFKELIGYLATQVTDGRKVHVGCIGGHGRTGLVLAALRKQLAGDDDAIAHVRAGYCKKAVETREQVNWLRQHWGLNTADPSYGFSGGDAYSERYRGSSGSTARASKFDVGYGGYDGYGGFGAPRASRYKSHVTVEGTIPDQMLDKLGDEPLSVLELPLDTDAVAEALAKLKKPARTAKKKPSSRKNGSDWLAD